MSGAIVRHDRGATAQLILRRARRTCGAGAADDNIPHMLEGLKRPSELDLGAAACLPNEVVYQTRLDDEGTGYGPMRLPAMGWLLPQPWYIPVHNHTADSYMMRPSSGKLSFASCRDGGLRTSSAIGAR